MQSAWIFITWIYNECPTYHHTEVLVILASTWIYIEHQMIRHILSISRCAISVWFNILFLHFYKPCVISDAAGTWERRLNVGAEAELGQFLTCTQNQKEQDLQSCQTGTSQKPGRGFKQASKLRGTRKITKSKWTIKMSDSGKTRGTGSYNMHQIHFNDYGASKEIIGITQRQVYFNVLNNNKWVWWKIK